MDKEGTTAFCPDEDGGRWALLSSRGGKDGTGALVSDESDLDRMLGGRQTVGFGVLYGVKQKHLTFKEEEVILSQVTLFPSVVLRGVASPQRRPGRQAIKTDLLTMRYTNGPSD